MRHRWLLALALVAPACLFPGLDDLTSGPDGSDPDVSADVAADAAGDGADAVSDASVCADASDATFCASLCPAPVFCDDFDLDTTFGRWTDGLLIGGGGGGSIQDGGVSPPHQAAFTTKTSEAGSAFAEARTQLPGASLITVEGDVTINVPASHYGVFVVETTALPPYKTTRVFLNVAGSAWDLGQEVDLTDGGTAGSTTAISASVPTGWFHLTFTIDTTAHTASAMVDGTTIADKLPISPAFTPGNYTVRAGIYFVSPPSSFQKVLLDNVVVHAQ